MGWYIGTSAILPLENHHWKQKLRPILLNTENVFNSHRKALTINVKSLISTW